MNIEDERKQWCDDMYARIDAEIAGGYGQVHCPSTGDMEDAWDDGCSLGLRHAASRLREVAGNAADNELATVLLEMVDEFEKKAMVYE
jgi:hypothetical protein